MKGKFITFEGSEGSGKSTQARMAEEYIKSKKIPVLFIREPGTARISEAIRKILLDVKNKEMTDECETMLYMAARSQVVGEVIIPALKKGTVVLSDRFLDSTIVYQGYGNGVDIDFIKKCGDFAVKGVKPDLTILFDIDTKQGLSRAGKNKDRIEQRNLAYHNRVRKGYQELAQRDSDRIKLVKVDKDKDEIFKTVKEFIDKIVG